MGWGTFAAGQALRWVRSTRSSTDPLDDLITGATWLAGHFHRSYLRKVLQGSALLHPEVWDSVDLDIWEEDIDKVILKNWRIMMALQIVTIPLQAFLFWPLLFFHIPFFWYYPKRRLIRQHQAQINDELRENGWDVDHLLSELQVKLTERAVDEKADEERERERKERIRRRRKYGRGPNQSPDGS